jgi:hypothetical protein
LHLSLIFDPIVTHEQVFDCNDGGSCRSVDVQRYFHYVRTVNFEDFDLFVDTSNEMDLLISINANWDEDMDPTHNPHALDAAHTSRSPRTDPLDEDLVF